MAQASLRDFGRGLPAAELGAALAGLISERHPSWRPTRRGRVHFGSWRFLNSLESQSDAVEARASWIAKAKPLVMNGGPRKYGLAVDVGYGGGAPRGGRFDATWLAETIGAGELVSSFHFVTAAERPRVEWLWPLDIAVFEDADSRELRETFSHLHWARFVKIVSAERATAPIEMLVLTQPLASALAHMLTHSTLPPVQCILVLGGYAGPFDPVPMAEQLRKCARADAACVATISAKSRGAFFDAILLELSHDMDLDVAFTVACRAVGAKPPLMVAARNGFARANVSGWGRHIGGRVALTPTLRVPPLRFAHGSPSHVGRQLIERMSTFAFDSERGEATDIADLGRATRAMPPPVKQRERFVQAQLFDGPALDARRIDTAPLAPRTYRLDVWIGAASADALVAPAVLPEDELPPSAKGHALTVAMTAAGISTAPEVRFLTLPVEGSSERVSFHFSIPDALRRLEARIAVLHRNRVLQTLLLAADVGEGQTVPLALSLEVVVRRDLGSVAGRRPFDAALITNQLGEQRTVSVFAGDRASLVPAGTSIAQYTDELSVLLENATNSAKEYGKPDVPATSELLAGLARKGVLLRDALLDMPQVHDDLALAKRIQIISAKPDEAPLPLEICYDGPGPNDGATTCPNWQAALASGTCQASCPADRATVVCPVAFWGNSRTIERHAYDKLDAAKLGPNAYALQSEPTDGRVRLSTGPGSLCAAAAAARAVDGAAVDAAFADAGQVAMPTSEVKTWAAWQGAVVHNPALMVLLAHSDQKAGVRTLVIGTDETLFISSVDGTYVGHGGGHGPVVLLLGCSTGIAELAFQSVVARFCRAGAAIVVGTLCEILGKHAAPIGSQILLELQRVATDPEGMPFGDLIPVVRRTLLSRGYPIVMAIAPYGDADWRV